MKKYFINSVLFILVLTSCAVPAPTPNAADIEKEEQAIYAFFVSSNTGTTLILQETSTDVAGQDPKEMAGDIKSDFKDVSSEAVESYIARNAQSSQLSPDMDLGHEYILLTYEELSKITSQPNWHEVIAEKYPASGGYTMFSRVGFNNSLDQAVIYVGSVAGPLMGAGYYYLMEKQNGEWAIKEQRMVWIS